MPQLIRGYKVNLRPGRPPVIILMDGRKRIGRCRFVERLPAVDGRITRDRDTGFVEIQFALDEYGRVVDLLRNEDRVWVMDEAGGLSSGR